MKKANKIETAMAADEAEMRSISTGEVLREKGLCPFVLVRSPTGGVHMGYLVRVSEGNRCVELLESRCLWRWQGANSLREVALHGVNTNSSRITEAVPQLVLFNVDEILIVSEEAKKTLDVSVWAA